MVSMSIDTLSRKRLAIIAGGGCGFLILGIILGAVGPAMLVATKFSVYDCPNNSKVWDNTKCNGKQLGQGDTLDVFFDELSTMNRFFSVSATPFTTVIKTNDKTRDSFVFTSLVTVYKLKENNEREEVEKHREKHEVVCALVDEQNEIKGACTRVTFVIDHSIRSSRYQISISLERSDDSEKMGDFEIYKGIGNRNYGNYELAMNITFVILSASLLIAFLFTYFRSSFSSWTLEQKLFMVFVGTLFFYNNPFLSFKYIVGAEWFFNFVDSFFKDVFVTYSILFWVIIISVTIEEDIRTATAWKKLLPKFIILALFFIIISAMHLWENVILSSNPFLESMANEGTVIFFIIVLVLIIVGMVGWVLFDISRNMKSLSGSQFLQTRIFFVAIPSIIMVISQIVVVSTSAHTSLRKSSFQIGYFSFLYNTLGFVFFLGYFPVKGERTSTETVSEKNEFVAQENGDDEEESQPFIHKMLPNISIDED